MMKYIFVVLAILLITGCGMKEAPDKEMEEQEQAVAEDVAVDDIESELGDVDSLIDDLDMSELDTLEAELNGLSLE